MSFYFILMFVDYYNFMFLHWLYAIDKLNGLHGLFLFLVLFIFLIIDLNWPTIKNRQYFQVGTRDPFGLRSYGLSPFQF